MPKLIRDTLMRKFESVQKDGLPKGVLAVLRGPCMEIEKVNENNRWYPRSLIIRRILNDEDTQHLLKENALIGEGCHPEERFQSEYPNTAILIKKLWIPDDDQDALWIEFWILDTPVGRILKTLVDVGSSIGISARAVGDAVERDGVEYMDEDTYTFFTFDTVPDPGFKSARPVPVFESKLLNKKLEDYTKPELEQTQALLEQINPTFFAGQIEQVKTLLEQKEKDKTPDLFKELCESRRRIVVLEKSLESMNNKRPSFARIPKPVLEQSLRANKQATQNEHKMNALSKSLSEVSSENSSLRSKVRDLEREKNEALSRVAELESQLEKAKAKPTSKNEGHLSQESVRLKKQLNESHKRNLNLSKALYESQVTYLSSRSGLSEDQVRRALPTIEGNPDKYLSDLRKMEQYHSQTPKGTPKNESYEADDRLASLIASQQRGVTNA